MSDRDPHEDLAVDDETVVIESMVEEPLLGESRARSPIDRWLAIALAVLVVAVIGIGYAVYLQIVASRTPTTMAGAEIARIEAQLAEDPGNTMLYLRLADAYFSMKKYDRAADALIEVRSIESTGYAAAQATYGLARISQARGDVEEAIDYYNESFEVQDLPEAHYDLGRLYLSREETETAMAEWEAYLELAPTDGGMMRELGALYEAAGDFDRALALYRQALIFIPDDAETQASAERLSTE